MEMLVSFRMRQLIGALVGLAAFQFSDAQPAGEVVWIPMQDKGFFSTQDIKLQATLYKPEGEGPFPVVIFNHGSTGPGSIPANRVENPAGFARYLQRKGVALLIPMRRGRGMSEGAYNEAYDCRLASAGIRYATESLDAVYAFIEKQEWADRGKIVLAGQSRGGILSVVYAAERQGSAVGVLNFVGGWMSDRCNISVGDVNIDVFSDAGSKSKVPNLFLYAKNDSFYGVSSIEAYAAAFSKSGGSVEFKLYDLGVGVNGHHLFHSYWRQWAPDVDLFFERLGIGRK